MGQGRELLAALLMTPLLFAAAPAKKPAATPVPEETTVDLDKPIDSLDDTPPELAKPADGTHVLGGSFTDAKFGFEVPSLGAEWTRVSPVEGTTSVRAAFVHARAEKVRALVAVSVQVSPSPKDLAGFAKANFDTLTNPELGFTVDKRFNVKVAGHDAFVVDFSSATKTRKFEQLYFALPNGSIAVLTFQAPAPIFDGEVVDFRNASRNIRLR